MPENVATEGGTGEPPMRALQRTRVPAVQAVQTVLAGGRRRDEEGHDDLQVKS